MTDFIIRTLQHDDASNLLEFESSNRAWFEQNIDPRPADFYSMRGVAAHIDLYLNGYHNGTWHPCVIVNNDGRIIGRANLKDINRGEGSAEAGYRIARHATGKGLATLAVRHLMELAWSQWKLSRLLAYVKTDNLASAKVLEKCRFERMGLPDNTASVNDPSIHSYQFIFGPE